MVGKESKRNYIVDTAKSGVRIRAWHRSQHGVELGEIPRRGYSVLLSLGYLHVLFQWGVAC